MTPPRLLEQVRAEIRARHYSRRTEDAYVHWIRRFIVFHGRRHPRELGAPEISAFLTWLAVEQHVAASTQNQALSGVLFLYREVLRQDVGVVELLPRARMPSKVPVVLSPSEVRQVLDQLTGVPRIVATLLYGAGLRLQECLELRVKDLDFERREITVRRGKGQKDRRVMLPDAVRKALEAAPRGGPSAPSCGSRGRVRPGRAAWGTRSEVSERVHRLVVAVRVSGRADLPG